MNSWVSSLVVACALAELQQFERVIVNVNGGIFTLTELERRQAAVIGQATGTTPALAALRSNPALRESLNAVTPRRLRSCWTHSRRRTASRPTPSFTPCSPTRS